MTSQLVDPSGPQLNQAAPPPPSLAPDEQLPQSYQMLKQIGIPARLVAGYTEGSRTSADRWAVRSDDAHAWTEVYFSGYGWITFEATPAGGDGTAHAAGYQTRAPAIRHPGATPSASAAVHPGAPGGAPAITPSMTADQGAVFPPGPRAARGRRSSSRWPPRSR